ncbi:IPT/TIG domain-containing protein [Chryseolinea soli]|uniref:IPT/TIG domain-containing protein n=1 Tax=Chryseolinea soli TaxID=2321403 RepID=A0A385STA1_9BACT|nr:IPT/TIG domain-containing protein [Chryseolinea soli]AYB35063.1 hypothetical protein D4L85_32755 [Chryseolinea soli]
MKSFIASSMIFIVSAVSQQCAHEYEFSDDPPRHSISQISPVCGRMGDTLTITGKDFSDITSKNTVFINGTKAAVLLASSTYLTAIVPARAGSGNVSVVVDKAEATGPNFTYLPTGVVTIASNDLQMDGLAADVQKNIYVVRAVLNSIYKRASSGAISFVAGGGRAGNTSGYFNGYGSFALFDYPSDVAVDSKGNVYVSDTGNNCIRMIAPDGYVSLYAGVDNFQYGHPQPGYLDGPRNQAYFDRPRGLFIDKQDNLYVCDEGNVRVRMITPDANDLVGNVTTIAGTGEHGGKDGPALQATFSFVRDLVVDDDGNIFLTEAYEPARVRKIASNTGVVSTILDEAKARYGCSGEPYVPLSIGGVALGPEGNVYCSAYVRGSGSYLTDRTKIITIASDNTISALAGGADANGPREGIGEKVHFPFTGYLIMMDGALYTGTDYQLVRVEPN